MSITEIYVTEMIHDIFRTDDTVPIINHAFIHFFNARELTNQRPVGVLECQEIAMSEMRVGDYVYFTHMIILYQNRRFVKWLFLCRMEQVFDHLESIQDFFLVCFCTSLGFWGICFFAFFSGHVCHRFLFIATDECIFEFSGIIIS